MALDGLGDYTGDSNIVLGLADTTVTKLSRCLVPYLATMFAVAVVITFVPWLIYIVPSLRGLY